MAGKAYYHAGFGIWWTKSPSVFDPAGIVGATLAVQLWRKMFLFYIGNERTWLTLKLSRS